MKKVIVFSIILIIIASTQGLFAQAPKYSNEFLAIGVGARGVAMGNVQIASVNDVTSAYWNPAGMVNIESNIQGMYMHSANFAGIVKHDYLGLSFKIDKDSRFGVSGIRLGVDDIPNTLDLLDNDGNIDYDRISSFSVADYAFLFTYSKRSKLLKGLDYGANLKIINRKAGDFAKAWGFGLDAGAQYKLKNWKFGISGHDITSTFNAWTYNTETFEETFIKTGNEIPKNSIEITMPRLVFGAAREFKVLKDKFTIMPEIDFDMTFDNKRNVVIKGDFASIDPHIGLEVVYADLIYLRAGTNNIQEITKIEGGKSWIYQPSFGIGLNLKAVAIDYALVKTNLDESEGLYSNIFSIKLNINNQK